MTKYRIGPESLTVSLRLTVNGIVQGVGFRPFVYQLAQHYGLKGTVANTSSGVTIHIEGREVKIQAFIRNLAENAPPLAHITEIASSYEPAGGYEEFTIQGSQRQSSQQTLISPDMAICDDCLRELFDPNDRRHKYPFINCTNCGPRYTIIDDIPYDRPNTSMKHFTMCRECRKEYDDPANRRFHAQPNACAVCGPNVSLYDNHRTPVPAGDPIKRAAELLKKGYIVAIKGLGGFHLAVDAENNVAVIRLRQRKHREEKPFALMSYDLDLVREYARIEPGEEVLLTSPQRPVVLLKKEYPNPLSPEVSPHNKYFGAMLPYTPFHYLLLNCDFTALVMTSGNMSEEPIAIDNDEVFERLDGIADYFLVHNRDIYLRSDDSVVRMVGGTTRFVRRSRGYVPIPVFLKEEVPQILACGAELKNTVCLTKGPNAFLSQHIGDLENLETYRFFELTIGHMKRILDIDPQIVACDLHPDYLSTGYAQEQKGIEKIAVQHHHAHIVSCMAENRLDGPVIGLSFDGTGYGTDGRIWGGEVLIAETHQFERAAHLAYLPMPGGAAAIKEPWRMAISYLYDAFGEGFLDLKLPFFQDLEKKKIEIIMHMISKKVNSPQTSSLGRLFDGVAAILGIRNKVAYEGQAAMELEMAMRKDTKESYGYEWERGKDSYQIPVHPIIRGVVWDMKNGLETPDISNKFHMTLILLFSDICTVLRKETGLDRVVFSGGVFQNATLLVGLKKALEEKDFQVFTHSLVPCNDGGISLGQAVVAAARIVDC
ncbi:MAG: carbamoyltransferase HypF [Desulfobacterales bacterium S5133MH4]|jgi:hydrogenase maturation protein HypF|nr:MAG: carbamoyltransferase HypF [Desulfobacterales bacterium S5133MH4]